MSYSADQKKFDRFKFCKLAREPRGPDGELKEDVLGIIGDDFILVRNADMKSDYHVLLVARKEGLLSPSDLKFSDIGLLKKMRRFAKQVASLFLRLNPTNAVRIGFHAIPSMMQLHMHIMSMDFSETDTVRQWIKNNTDLFVDLDRVIGELTAEGRVTSVPGDHGLLHSKPRCGRCRKFSSTRLTCLKDHIRSCPFPKRMVNHSLFLGEQATISDEDQGVGVVPAVYGEKMEKSGKSRW